MSAVTQALPLAIVIPIAGAVLVPLASRISQRLSLALAVAASAASIVVLLICAPSAYRGNVTTAYLGNWAPIGGHSLGIAITGDAFGITAALIAAIVGSLALLATLSGMEELGPRELGAFGCLALLLIASVIGGALTADLLNMFVWFEVAALASYALTGFFLSRPPAVEAAFKIVVLTSIAGFLVFIGTALLYQSQGAVNLAQLRQSLGAPAGVIGTGVIGTGVIGTGVIGTGVIGTGVIGTGVIGIVALGLLVSGFATKAGLIPYCGWLPDAHTAAPGPISALFSGVLVNFGVVAIARVGVAFAPTGIPLPGILMVVGVGSALLGAGFAVAQDDLKRLLAYDTISQIGIVIVGFAASSDTGDAGLTYHLVSHALFKAMLFLIAGAIVHSTAATTLPELAGMVRRYPWLVALFTLGAAAIAGIPPLNGYVSLGLIHDALLERHEYGPYALILVAQAVTVAALGRVVIAMFTRREGDFDRDERIRPGMGIALGTLATACVATGILGLWMLDHVIAPAATVLSHGAAWSAAVLAGSGHIPMTPVPFDYANPGELAATAGCVVVGVILLRWLAPAAESIRARLTLVATGSVNDYATYLAAGTILMCLVLAA